MNRVIGLVLCWVGAGLLLLDTYHLSTGQQLDTLFYAVYRVCHGFDPHAWIAGFSHSAIMLLGGIILYSPELKRLWRRSHRP